MDPNDVKRGIAVAEEAPATLNQENQSEGIAHREIGAECASEEWEVTRGEEARDAAR